MRTKTCPLFEKRIIVDAVGALLLLAFTRSGVERADMYKGPGYLLQQKMRTQPVRFG